MLRSNSDSPNEPRFEGFCVDLIEKLAELIGFNYTINLVKDSRYGVRLENATWNGIVGELIRRVSLQHIHITNLTCSVPTEPD